jgi:hypothetical protein
MNFSSFDPATMIFVQQNIEDIGSATTKRVSWDDQFVVLVDFGDRSLQLGS